MKSSHSNLKLSFLALSTATFLLCALQLVFGASIVAVGVTLLICIATLLVMRAATFQNIGALIIVLATFRYLAFPLIAKSAFGDPIDANYFSPDLTFLAIFFGLAGYMLAFVAVSRIPVGRPLFGPQTNLQLISRLEILSGIAGSIGIVSQAATLDPEAEGHSITYFLTPLLLLAIVCSIFRVHYKYQGSKTVDLRALVWIALQAYLSVIVNSRYQLIVIVIVLIVSSLAIGGQGRLLKLFGYSVAAVALIAVATPVMLVMRSHGTLSLGERISETATSISNYSETLEDYYALQDKREFNRKDADSSYYGGAYQNVLERVSFIDHVDKIVRGVEVTDTLGWAGLSEGLIRVMPSFVVDSKPDGYSHGDWVNCALSMRCALGGFTTLPLIADGYACYGMIGAFAFPFTLFGALLLLVKKASTLKLTLNPIAIYLLLRVHDAVIEGGLDTNLVYIFRYLPQELFLIGAMIFLARIIDAKGQRGLRNTAMTTQKSG